MTGKQLKNSILQWAIQGKLVPQDPNDEPASVLLEKIRAEKARLVKEGKIKKDKKESIIYRGDDNSYYEKFADGTTVCIDDEIPFDVPKGWEWCRVCQVIYPPKYGTSNKSLQSGNIPVLRMGNIQEGEIVYDKLVYSNNEEDNKKYNLINGDLLFNRTNSAELVGKTGIYRGQRPAIFAGYIILLRPIIIVSDYLNFTFGSSYVRSYCKEVKTIGVQQCNINADKISALLIPLPPLAEQYRIVDKIQKLLPVVKQYINAQLNLDNLNENIKPLLRKSILQEAIQGKLVSQDDSEESASILLQRIKEEKLRLVKEGKLKKKDIVDSVIYKGDDNKYYEQKGKEVTDITDEIPFKIPNSWEWCRISQCCERIFSGKSPIYSKTLTKHIIIGQQANQWERIEMQYAKFGTDEYAEKVEEYQYLLDGDVLLNTLGNGTLGRCGIFENITERVLTDGHLLVFRTISKALAKYILFYLTVNYTEINKNAGGSTNQTFLNISKVSKYLIPLPPLNEIERIVIKKEELYTLL